MRIMLNHGRLNPKQEMFGELNWLSVLKLINKENMLFLYKINHGLVPEHFWDFLLRRSKQQPYSIR